MSLSLNTTFQNTPEEIREDRRSKIEPLLKLLDEKPQEARTFADKLLSNGIPITSITNATYEHFRKICLTNLAQATEIAHYFSGKPYHWDCWLINPTITKFKKEPDYN